MARLKASQAWWRAYKEASEHEWVKLGNMPQWQKTLYYNLAMVLGAVLVDGHDKVVDEMYDIHALENQGAQEGATVLISIGRQDLDGFVKRMPLDRLLRSLIDIGGPR